ncbi:hypothetical protein [Hyunsoonleella pacifica]|uniref:Uncharacterized protein n=1 Tax=Hyunsoonleella pacifica TaxID=1080224 RepID=A0A4Q9FNG8_9FLAO|nr:hypothetical protein [Hyunsoonleella pacifica]TBN15790.1 hypothetical protein EYD46_11760 [Hyunsoonleella pacifica]GGD22677.1 hypothetical protein GCM10011368_25920 [Hyunsoonleella pacifica]
MLCFGCKHSKESSPTIAKSNIVKVKIIKESHPVIDSLKLNINYKKRGNYNTLKTHILKKRTHFKILYSIDSTKAIDSASHFIYDQLINNIVPHWYGTSWDFNGHTNIPNVGDIACGYFVSTTLKHLGFNINRYKMAQQAGLIEAQALQAKDKLKLFSNVSFEVLKQKLNTTYTNGIYFVGLDNHVGYILLKDKELYFLHSSYYDDKVMIELAETSPCFNSNFYVFAEITTNNTLVKKWILNEKLVIPTS